MTSPSSTKSHAKPHAGSRPRASNAAIDSSYERSFDLLCPGPVNVHARVRAAATSFEFGHREEELSILLGSVRQRVLDVAGVNSAAYASVVLTGSGTAANESVLASAVRDNETVVVIANGEFGERLANISTIYNRRTVCLEHDWGDPVDLRRVAQAVQDHKPSLVAMVHHETSCGRLNPVEEVGALLKGSDTRLFVDAVSSFSADPLDLEAAGVDFMSSSSGKAIGSYPGVSVVVGTHDAFRSLQDRTPRCHYLDLYRHYEFAERVQQTPNTPAVPLLLALNEALALALEEGMNNRFDRLGELAQYARAEARRCGLKPLLADGGRLSNVLTSIELPSDLPFDVFHRALREQGFVIYGGKGPFAGRTFQISTIGTVDTNLLDRFFASVEQLIGDRREDVARRPSAKPTRAPLQV